MILREGNPSQRGYMILYIREYKVNLFETERGTM